MTLPNQQNNSGAIFVSADDFQNLTVHKNLGQEVIVTTKDKIELALIEQQRYVKLRRDWITPAGLFLSLIATLVAADFKNSFGVPATTWQSIFICLALASAIWLIITGTKALKYRGKGDNLSFIEKIANKIQE